MMIEELAGLLLTSVLEGDPSVEIKGVQMDSRKVKPGDLFFCIPAIPGFLTDRHQYAKEAVKAGAAALVVEHDVPVYDIPKVFVKDARFAMAVMSSHFYGYPSLELKVVGITGTNGKTTTSYILEKILSDYSLNVGLIGNIGIQINGEKFPTDINTPEPPALQKNLRLMRDKGADVCIMEVTSQGLDMGRVMGTNYRTAIFTNLTSDHLDYHGTFEEYKKAKSLLFSRLGNSCNSEKEGKKYAVINADDPASLYFQETAAAEVVTYGITNKADIMAACLQLTNSGTRFTVHAPNELIDMEVPLAGRFNVYNVLAAISAAWIEGVPLSSMKESLKHLQKIEGRMEVVQAGQPFTVLVDYAHTPDALQNALETIQEFAKGRIITVFGCGGDRDHSKRPKMAATASKSSDYIFLTSDNPRSENPASILMEIQEGFSSNFNSFEAVEDRKTAIKKAVEMAQPGDVVFIAGKGHETYQVLKHGTIPFDDREIAKTAIIERKK